MWRDLPERQVTAKMAAAGESDLTVMGTEGIKAGGLKELQQGVGSSRL